MEINKKKAETDRFIDTKMIHVLSDVNETQ